MAPKKAANKSKAKASCLQTKIDLKSGCVYRCPSSCLLFGIWKLPWHLLHLASNLVGSDVVFPNECPFYCSKCSWQWNITFLAMYFSQPGDHEWFEHGSLWIIFESDIRGNWFAPRCPTSKLFLCYLFFKCIQSFEYWHVYYIYISNTPVLSQSLPMAMSRGSSPRTSRSTCCVLRWCIRWDGWDESDQWQAGCWKKLGFQCGDAPYLCLRQQKLKSCLKHTCTWQNLISQST